MKIPLYRFCAAFITVGLALVASPVRAADDSDVCGTLSGMAEEIMKERQAGEPMSQVVQKFKEVFQTTRAAIKGETKPEGMSDESYQAATKALQDSKIKGDVKPEEIDQGTAALEKVVNTLIIDAYDKPQFPASLQQDAVNTFRDSTYSACFKAQNK